MAEPGTRVGSYRAPRWITRPPHTMSAPPRLRLAAGRWSKTAKLMSWLTLGSCELDAAARRIEDGDESGSGRLTNREADVERIQDGAERLRLRRLGAERSEPQTVGAVVGGG